MFIGKGLETHNQELLYSEYISILNILSISKELHVYSLQRSIRQYREWTFPSLNDLQLWFTILECEKQILKDLIPLDGWFYRLVGLGLGFGSFSGFLILSQYFLHSGYLQTVF